MEELETKYADKAVFLKADVDKADELAEEFDVDSMPTFLFIKDTVVVEQFAGGDAAKLKKMMVKLTS